MWNRSDPVSDAQLRSLHRRQISSADGIHAVLNRALLDRVELWRGMNRRVDRETATIESLSSSHLVLATTNFDPIKTSSLRLNLVIDGVHYFFLTESLGEPSPKRLRAALPSALFEVERRTGSRVAAGGSPNARSLSVVGGAGKSIDATLLDQSFEGLGIAVTELVSAAVEPLVRIRMHGHQNPPTVLFGEVRNRAPIPERPGWVRIGVAVRPEPHQPPVRIEVRDDVLGRSRSRQLQQRLRVMAAAAQFKLEGTLNRLRRGPGALPVVHLIDYENDRGEKLRAIVNSYGDTRGAPAVVIPPAWGRTKETLLPLAETVVETFRRAGQPIVVLRFDGIRRRGESHNDAGCRDDLSDHLRFTFSQGVEDIKATLDFLERDRNFQPSRVALTTFSAASIDGRKAVALDAGRRLCGWVSVVGSADLQSMMRVISGGIDFVGGVAQGVQFGLQEILGVLVDIDHAGRDAVQNRLAFLEDSLDDMRSISIPITWIHGRHDAWMDVGRVQRIMAEGPTSNRRLVSVPTGHQLRSSREAIETFQLIARELSGFLLGRPLEPTMPSLISLDRMRRAELERLPRRPVELRSFWKQYLLGRGASRLGIELMTATAAHQGLMKDQVERLAIRGSDRIADLGSGLGALATYLAAEESTPSGVVIDQFDFVREAFRRTAARLAKLQRANAPRVLSVACDFGSADALSRIPARDATYDSVLASLLIGYLPDPTTFLREIWRILKPGGRLVLSNLRRDADISGVFTQGYEELRTGLARRVFEKQETDALSDSARDFLNDAARLLDLEETGVFSFWDAKDLIGLMKSARFIDVSASGGLGNPPQAVIIRAKRP